MPAGSLAEAAIPFNFTNTVLSFLLFAAIVIVMIVGYKLTLNERPPQRSLSTLGMAMSALHDLALNDTSLICSQSL
jgi:hypothetical protein